MDRKTFRNVVMTAIDWDCVAEPQMTPPCFDTVAEQELFAHICWMLNDDEVMSVLSQVDWIKALDKKSEEFVQLDSTFFLDIETVKTTRTDYRDRVAAHIKPPAQMKKAETIAEWEANEKQNAINEQIEKTVFNGGLCHIAQVQFACDDGAIVVLNRISEARLLELIFDAMKDAKKLVGHNLKEFDLIILKQRAMVLGLQIPNILYKSLSHKNGNEFCFDTMKEWGTYKDYVSMDNLCYYLGVESPKKEITGENFGQYYERGEWEKLTAYGIDEINSLREVYYKMTR